MEEKPGEVPETEVRPRSKGPPFTCKYCGQTGFPTIGALGGHVRKECEVYKQIKEKKKAKKIEEPVPKTRPPRVPEKEEGLFERVKTPHQILEEVLSTPEFGLNEDFIRAAVRRSERLGGLHPTDLSNMITTLRSGTKNKAEAEYIVEDYYYALMQEQRKAEQRGVRMTYPLGLRDEGEYRRGYLAPTYERGPPEPYDRGGQMPYEYRRAFGGGMSPQDVMQMVDRAMERREKEDRLRDMERSLDATKTELNEKISTKFDEVKKLIEEKPSGPVMPPGVVTKEDLSRMFEKKEDSELIRAQKERLEMERESRKTEREAANKRAEEQAKQFEKLAQRLEERPVARSTEGYTKDETRLLADTIQTLAPGRFPLRELTRGFQMILKPLPSEEAQPPLREKVGGGKGVLGFLPEEMLAEE